MSADQLFQRWIRWTLLVFVASFGYYLTADVWMPLTTDSLVQKYVVQLAPEVSGRVRHVAVQNNQPVAAGELLFELDPTDQQLQLELAKLQLQQMQQKHQQLLAGLDSTQARVDQAQVQLQQAQQDLKRMEQLRQQQLIPQQQLDQQLSVSKQAQAELKASQAAMAEVEAELGQHGVELVAIRQARTAVAQAELALARTRVTAPVAGIVSDLQLEVGTTLNVQQPVLALISKQQSWISAAFREKSLLNVNAGTAALVTFDAMPGQVFTAHVQTIDAGVATGQGKPDGQLATVESSNRWVRDAQRLKVNLVLDDKMPERLAVGARATVQLVPAASGWSHWLAVGQIRFVSLLHYVY